MKLDQSEYKEAQDVSSFLKYIRNTSSSSLVGLSSWVGSKVMVISRVQQPEVKKKKKSAKIQFRILKKNTLIKILKWNVSGQSCGIYTIHYWNIWILTSLHGKILYVILTCEAAKRVAATWKSVIFGKLYWVLAWDSFVYPIAQTTLSMIEILQQDLRSLEQLGAKRGMQFNASKYEVMKLKRGRTFHTGMYSLGSLILKQVDLTKYLVAIHQYRTEIQLQGWHFVAQTAFLSRVFQHGPLYNGA